MTQYLHHQAYINFSAHVGSTKDLYKNVIVAHSPQMGAKQKESVISWKNI